MPGASRSASWSSPQLGDQIATRGLDQLAERLAPATSTAERMAIAIRLYVEAIDEYEGAPGQITLLQAWAEADREPVVREMLSARRERLVGAGRYILAQGVATGELPSWLDVDAVTRAFLALLDGLLLQRSRPEVATARLTSSAVPAPSWS